MQIMKRNNKKVFISPYAFPGMRLSALPVAYTPMATDQTKEVSLVTSFDITESIEKVVGVTPEQLRGRTRTRTFAAARTLYCYFTRTMMKWSLKEIGSSIGRDHTTVMHALKNYHDFCLYDKEFEEAAKCVRQHIDRVSKRFAMSLN